MPNMFGSDQLGEDYDPSSYINGARVGDDTEEVVIGKWRYNVGVQADGTIVAERWPAKERFTADRESVPEDRIPAKARAAVAELVAAKSAEYHKEKARDQAHDQYQTELRRIEANYAP